MSGLNILFLGDVVGKPGREGIKKYLPKLIEKYKVDCVVCNAENAAGGFGITYDTAKELYDSGVNVITLGNHTWDKKETMDMLESDRKLVRPANYPKGNPGKGFRIVETTSGKRIGILSLMGRVFMESGLDCPFQSARNFMREYRLGDDYDALLVDVHAEATSEKLCIAHIFDGKASLVTGSHTHTPTADEHIFPKGTGFHSDTGMCGFYDSSLGMTFESALPRFERMGKAPMFQVATGEATVCGTLVCLHENGLCEKIHAIRVGGVLKSTEDI